MAPTTRSQFEAELARLGYRPPEVYDADPCTHRASPSLAVFLMLNVVCHEGARTHGDLGWDVYTGCEECCTGLVSSLCCGGHYEHARVFAGELEVTEAWNLGVRDIQSAAQPLDADEDADEETGDAS